MRIVRFVEVEILSTCPSRGVGATEDFVSMSALALRQSAVAVGSARSLQGRLRREIVPGRLTWTGLKSWKVLRVNENDKSEKVKEAVVTRIL